MLRLVLTCSLLNVVLLLSGCGSSDKDDVFRSMDYGSNITAIELNKNTFTYYTSDGKSKTVQRHRGVYEFNYGKSGHVGFEVVSSVIGDITMISIIDVADKEMTIAAINDDKTYVLCPSRVTKYLDYYDYRISLTGSERDFMKSLVQSLNDKVLKDINPEELQGKVVNGKCEYDHSFGWFAGTWPWTRILKWVVIVWLLLGGIYAIAEEAKK